MNQEHNESTVEVLQAEIAFHTEEIRELSDALALQQQDLLLCKRQIALLSEQLRSLRESSDSGGGEGLAGERPPHY